MTDERHDSAPRPETDAVTTGAITGTGTGGLGSAGGTDTTRDVSSVPRDADTPEPSGSPLDDQVERSGAGDQEIHDA
ncbi:MAG TPA: hypothetical protein VKA85_08890 [Candidatus Limnocylindrales bacterium]|nr:hypothetical protein [Candidatus Limnocylindrales bacterium]